MNSFSSLGAIWLAVALAMPDCFAADRTPTESGPAPKAAAAGQIADWIQQLNSPRFTERTEATRHLEEAGKSAFPALAEAVLGDNREATLRAIEILRKHSQEGDEATKSAAKEALQKIADSDHASAGAEPRPPSPLHRHPPQFPTSGSARSSPICQPANSKSSFRSS